MGPNNASSNIYLVSNLEDFASRMYTTKYPGSLPRHHFLFTLLKVGINSEIVKFARPVLWQRFQ
jgi:hypothetical protein